MVQVDVFAVDRHGFAGEQRSQGVQALVRATTAGGGVGSGIGDLLPVFTTDTDGERDAARRQRGDVGELAGHDQRWPKTEEERPDRHRQVVVERQQGRGLEQPVHPPAVAEAHMIDDPEMGDTCRVRRFDERPTITGRGTEILEVRNESDRDASIRRSPLRHPHVRHGTSNRTGKRRRRPVGEFTAREPTHLRRGTEKRIEVV